MIRVLGSLLIASSSCWLGERQAQTLHRRRETLYDLVGSLEQLRRELEFHQTPLPELFAWLVQVVPTRIQILFSVCEYQLREEGIMTGWSRGTEQILMLTQDERQTLSSLGEILGRYPVREQSEAIGAVCTYLKQCGERAEMEYRRMGKVYRGLGAACGGILIILLL